MITEVDLLKKMDGATTSTTNWKNAEDSSKASKRTKNDGLDDNLVLYGKKLPVSRLMTYYAIIHGLIFLYALAFWIQVGVDPWLTKKLGVDMKMYGYLQTTFAFLQLCGGPLFGRFGDLHGGRAALLIAFISATLMYFMLWAANSIPFLFIAKVPSLLMHAMQGGQMLATDLSSAEGRADALGKLGLPYGLGMITGPAIGGVVTRSWSPQVGALLACTISALCLAIVYFFIPTSTKISPRDKTNSSQLLEKEKQSSPSLMLFLRFLGQPQIAILLLLRFVSGVPLGVFQSMFSVASVETFGIDASQSGFVLSYVGLLSLAMQGFGVGFMTRRFADTTLLWIGLFTLVPYYLGLVIITEFKQIYAVIPFVVFAMAIMNVVVTSALTKSVTEEHTGSILGINMAVNSLVRTMSPTLGGFLFANYGFSSFGWLGLISCPMIVIILCVKHISTSGQNLDKTNAKNI